jgi:hypothetical protein
MGLEALLVPPLCLCRKWRMAVQWVCTEQAVLVGLDGERRATSSGSHF